MHPKFKIEINRIAETHFSIRPMLDISLKKQIITPQGKTIVGNYHNYYDMWTGSMSDKFFDMGTFIRLGSCIENCLKYYYMDKKGYTTINALKADPAYEQNIFQRLMPWTQRNAMDLYKSQLQIDFTTFRRFDEIQEAMLHRHLYAHSVGLIDDKYIADLKRLTTKDLLADPKIQQNYGNDDLYYFEPLTKLNDFIEAMRGFFGNFP